MAKAKTKWKYISETNTAQATYSDDEIVVFKLDDIHPDVLPMAIYNGAVQKMSDGTARSADSVLDLDEVKVVHSLIFDRLTIEGKWNAISISRESIQKKIKDGIKEHLSGEEAEQLKALLEKAKVIIK